MQLMDFTEQPMSAYPAEEGLKFGGYGADVLEQILRPGRGQPAL
jgi:hypothetical protein